MTDSELLDALYLLLPTQLDDVILRCRAPEAHLPPPQASQAARALALVRWVQTRPDARPALLDALDAARRATAASPLLRWQQACYAEYRQVRVVGYEDKAKIRLDLDDVFVPLHLMPGVAREVAGPRGGAAKGDALAALGRDAQLEVLDVDLPGALAEVERLRDEGTRLRGLALLGEPGAGKTTLMRWLYCHALPGRGAQGRGGSNSRSADYKLTITGHFPNNTKQPRTRHATQDLLDYRALLWIRCSPLLGIVRLRADVCVDPMWTPHHRTY